MNYKGFTNIAIIILIVIIIAGVAIYFYWAKKAIVSVEQTKTIGTPSPQVCNQDTKLCPDGSYVYRTGHNCEFAACPESTIIPEIITYRDEFAGIEFEIPNKSTAVVSELAGIVENGVPKGITISDIDVAAKLYAGKYFGFPNGLPIGTNVSLSPLTVNGQEARLLSGEVPQQYFVLFIKLPKIVDRWGNQYSYYAISSRNKKYLDQIIPTITYFNPVKDEEKICSTVPKFEQYQVDSVFSGVPKVDFSLDVFNHYQPRDSVSEEAAVKAKAKPDFAGYYTIVTSGCGTSCLSIGAVDLRTGAAYAVIITNGDGINYKFGDGINYKLNSRLFSYSSGNQTRYYLWENNRSKLLCVLSNY
jgi:hypothetical protein